MRHWFKRGRTRSDAAAPSEVDGSRAEVPDLAGRAAFLKQHILIHTHVPKTAGSSLSSGLSAIVGGVKTMDLRLRRAIPMEALSPEDLDGLDLISGHFEYGVHTRFTRRPLYFAAVRDPVERAVSNYRFLLSHEDHGDHLHVVGRDFEAAWDALDKAHGLKRHNEQARLLMGARRGAEIDPDALLRQIEEIYLLVIPTPRMSEALTRLRAAFGVAWARIPKTNVSRGNEVEVSPAMADRIRAASPADCALWDMVEAGFGDQLGDACRFIASHCLQEISGDT